MSTLSIWELDLDAEPKRATRVSDGFTVKAHTQSELDSLVQTAEEKVAAAAESERCALAARLREEARAEQLEGIDLSSGDHPVQDEVTV